MRCFLEGLWWCRDSTPNPGASLNEKGAQWVCGLLNLGRGMGVFNCHQIEAKSYSLSLLSANPFNCC